MNDLSYSWRGILALLAAAPLVTWTEAATAAEPACDSRVTGSGTYTMSNQNIDCTFRVHVPSGKAPEHGWPVVVIFHGWGGNEGEFLGNKSVISLANTRGYVLVAPRGLGSNEGEPNSWTFSGSDTGQDGASGAICEASTTPDYTYPSCSAIA